MMEFFICFELILLLRLMLLDFESIVTLDAPDRKRFLKKMVLNVQSVGYKLDIRISVCFLSFLQSILQCFTIPYTCFCC